MLICLLTGKCCAVLLPATGPACARRSAWGIPAPELTKLRSWPQLGPQELGLVQCPGEPHGLPLGIGGGFGRGSAEASEKAGARQLSITGRKERTVRDCSALQIWISSCMMPVSIWWILMPYSAADSSTCLTRIRIFAPSSGSESSPRRPAHETPRSTGNGWRSPPDYPEQ